MPPANTKKVDLFQAWIEVNRRRLPDYDPQYDPDTNTWTSWVPSEADQRFVVHWRNFGKRATSGAYVYVDGQFADGKLLLRNNPVQSTSVNGKRTASASVARFSFQPIQLTDDENPFELEDDRTVNAIGEIKVVINMGRNAGVISYEHGVVKQAKAINERTKKAGGHRVQYSDEVSDGDDTGARFRPDPTVTPLTFIFKYRPKDMLQAMGIIDRGEASDGVGRRRSSRAVKGETDIKTEAAMKAEDDIKREPRIKTEPVLKVEPGVKSEIVESSRAGSTSASRRQTRRSLKSED